MDKDEVMIVGGKPSAAERAQRASETAAGLVRKTLGREVSRTILEMAREGQGMARNAMPANLGSVANEVLGGGIRAVDITPGGQLRVLAEAEGATVGARPTAAARRRR